MMTLKAEVLELKKNCYNCKECPLGRKKVEGRDPHVFASGYVKSKIFFIAEAPGKQETVEKKPLVGRSGQFFESKILGAAGLKRSDVYITNSVMCRPEGNRNPLPAELEICRHHLDAQICLLKPKLLITMGNIPLQTCCGITGITKHRGKLILSREWSNGDRLPVFPIFHPSYGIRGSGHKEFAEDAKEIKKLYKLLQEDEIIECKKFLLLEKK